MEGLLGLFFIFIAIIQIAMIIKFFEMAGNISRLTRNMAQFTKYYYSMQEFKNQKHTADTNNALKIAPVHKPIAEKLFLDEYQQIYENDNDRFMDIANYFYKNDKSFYDTTIMQVFEKNSKNNN